jgi:uncharacterized repeat protein (TIGR01451 family)
MTDDSSGSTGPSLTRRQVLAATSGSALVGLAGCGEPDPDSCDLNTGWDQNNDTTLGDNEDDSDWQVVADPNNSAPVPRPANVYGIPIVSPFADSRWIDNEAGGTPTGSGPVTYAYCFCLPEGVDDPELTLQVQAAKEIVDIQLNGASLSFTSNTGPMGNEAMEEAETYDDPGLFEEGENCLRITISHPTDGILNVVGTLENGTADCDCECDCTPGGGECTLTLSKDTNGEFHYGQQATYTFEVCNDGDGECTGPLTVEDDLPDGVSFVSASGDWSGTVSGGVVTATNDSYGGLAPGECLTMEMTVEVAPIDEFPGGSDAIENCATLLQNDQVVAEDCLTHDITADTCRLSLGKNTDGAFHYGGQATYTYEVCNEQDEECTGPLTIEDDLPDGISFVSVSGNWTASVSGGVVEATNSSYGGLAPGDCLTLDMTVQVAPAGQFPGDPPVEVENCASLRQFGELVTEDCVTHPVTPGGECGLTLSKETDGEFNYGEEGTYVFEVCNEGDGACTSPLDITDELPTGVSFESVSGAGWTASQSGGVVTVTNDTYGALAPGECIEFEMTVQVAPPGEGPEEVENCATLFHGGDAVAEDCVSHPIAYEDCELSFEKSVDGEFHFGQENTYVFEICNEDEEPCGGPLTITDDLPDGISFVDIGGFWNATVSGGVVEATLDTSPLDPGECITAEMTVDVAPASDFPGGSDEVQNCATLLHDGDAVAEDCVSHPITPDPCELSLSKDTGEFGGFHYGGLGTYVFEICNVGDTDCDGPLTVEDDLPDGISLVSTGADWSTSVSGGVVTATNDSHDGLAPGDCLSLELTVAVDDASAFPGEPPHEIDNCATLSYSGSVQTEDCVTHTLTLGDPGDCPPVEHSLNTGYDQSAASTLGDGDDDDDWRLTQDTTGSGPVPRPATVAGSDTVAGTWPSPFPDSRWVSHQTDAAVQNDPANETIAYEYCFCLHENFTSPELSVRAFADDEVTDITLNGTALSFSGDGSVSFGSTPIEETYTDPGPFQAGENCLRITVVDTNDAVSGLNLDGRVRAENADCDCAPTCDLSLEKSTTGEFHYGQQFQAGYVFEVCNEGEEACSGELEIEDELPDGISGPVQLGSGMTGGVNGGVFEGAIQYSGLAPGECLTRELLVTVGDEDAFSGDPPSEVENCATLLQGGAAVAEDCATHPVTSGEPDPCPPVAFDLNTGYDQETETTLGDGVDDDDWTITVDETDPGSVPKQATVVNGSDIPGNWPAPFADSRWVSHAPDASYAPPPNSAFEYEYCFCLREGFHDPELDLQIRADNTITDIRLNGISLPFTGDGGFQGDPIEETYTDPDPFQAGENCLTLVLENELNSAGLNVTGTMTAQNADCDCTPCAPTLSKEAAGEFHYGEQASYLFTVCNEGDGECTEPFDVVDDLPDGISFVSAGGAWSGSVSGGEVTVTNNSYGGLAPGECIEFEMTIEVASQDEFPGDPPSEVENCATLLQGDDVADEDCASHDITVDEDPCPPVAFDLNSGYDQTTGTTLGEGEDDDDWDIVADGTNSGAVPRAATVASNTDSPGGSFADSRWISHRQNGDVSGGESFTYQYCFCLREGFYDPELFLQVQADDQVADIRLNGTALAFTGNGSFQGDPIQETYDDAELFQAGENCLDVVVEDTQAVFAGLNVSGTMTAQNADCDCEPGGEPDCALTLEKSTTGEFHYGEQHQAGYVFEVCNEGETACSGDLDISDPLPDGISGPVQPGSGLTGGVTGGVFEGTIQYSGLAPGECLTRELLVTVEEADAFPGDPPSEVENCATLEEDGEPVAEDCVTHPVTPGEEPACEFTFQKDTASEFNYGQQGTYTFELCSDPDLNDGECTGPITIEDDLPDGVSFVSVSGNWTATVSGGVVEATNDSYGGLAPGDCLTMEMTVEVAGKDEFPGDPPHQVTNCADLQHNGDAAGSDCVEHTIQ